MNKDIIKATVQSILTQENSNESLSRCSTTKEIREWRTEDDGIRSLSVYRKNEADESSLAEEVAHLKAAFPDKAKDSVCIELLRLAKKQGMSKEQFKDAVDNFIATHAWNTFTVADILNYDVRVRLYTGTDVYNACHSYGCEYDRLMYPRWGKIDGVMYHVKSSEVEMLPAKFRIKIKERLKQSNSK